jgi:NAD-dependent deacetylase
MPKKVLVLSGAGISAESGISTFRDAGGLWEGHEVMEVASPQGWHKNRPLVLDFYNQRRKQALECIPNDGHHYVQKLEEHYDVTVITQNVDDLHEKAGSSDIIHLHGELFKVRSTLDESLVYDLDGWELLEGDLCEKGSQLRPHIVWFGEMVPMMEFAIQKALAADYLIVVGTSLVVYPAASIVDFVPQHCEIYLIDPNVNEISINRNVKTFAENASTGMKKVFEELAIRD